jgi:hypothetical protein
MGKTLQDFTSFVALTLFIAGTICYLIALIVGIWRFAEYLINL